MLAQHAESLNELKKLCATIVERLDASDRQLHAMAELLQQSRHYVIMPDSSMSPLGIADSNTIRPLPATPAVHNPVNMEVDSDAAISSAAAPAVNNSEAVDIGSIGPTLMDTTASVISGRPPASGEHRQFPRRRPLRRHSDSTFATHSTADTYRCRRYSESGEVSWVPPADLCWKIRHAESAVDDDDMDCDD